MSPFKEMIGGNADFVGACAVIGVVDWVVSGGRMVKNEAGGCLALRCFECWFRAWGSWI